MLYYTIGEMSSISFGQCSDRPDHHVQQIASHTAGLYTISYCVKWGTHTHPQCLVTFSKRLAPG